MSAMKSLVEFLRKPEWIAAIALLIQAVILFLQAVILRRHGATMEEHAGIAKAQAETAKLIGQALDQQGKVLDEQTKIMDEQFKFQRTIELKAAGKLPRPGRSPRIGPGTGRGRRRGHIFLGRLATDFAALWGSRIPRGAARSRHSGRQAVSCGLRPALGRYWPDVLRRRGDRVLLPSRGRQECHFSRGCG